MCILFVNNEHERVRVKNPFVRTMLRVREQKSVRYEQCKCSRTKECSSRTAPRETNTKVFVAFVMLNFRRISREFHCTIAVSRRQRHAAMFVRAFTTPSTSHNLPAVPTSRASSSLLSSDSDDDDDENNVGNACARDS